MSASSEVLEVPDDRLVSKIRCQVELETTLERQPVGDRVLDLLVRKCIQLAQHQYIEHQAINTVWASICSSTHNLVNSTPLKKRAGVAAGPITPIVGEGSTAEAVVEIKEIRAPERVVGAGIVVRPPGET